MDAKYINPFLESLKRVLSSFGITDVKRGNIMIKENMYVDMDITSVIGLIGGVRGNVAYSFAAGTARNIASAMMMGAQVPEMNAIARSAIGELTNMVTGTASSMLSESKVPVDITPPSIIFGSDIYFIISSVPAITVDIETNAGKIQINIGLEI